MKPRTLSLAALLLFALPLAQTMVAQSSPSASASPSTASGQRSEPEANNGAKKQEAEEGSAAFRRSPAVQKLGSMLGMPPAVASSVFEWLNFAVLAAVLLYFVFKLVPQLLRRRSEGIQKGIVEARSATEEARLRLAAVEERLSRLDGEIAALRSESERGAAEDERTLAAQVEAEKQRILQAAEQEIAAAGAQAQRSLREYAAGVAVDRAAAQMQISPEDDRMLIRTFVGKLSGEGSRN